MSVEPVLTELPDSRAEELLQGFSKLRLLVVGDAFLDEYLRGDAERVSPEAPVPVVRVHEESCALGGAANVVRNIVALGAECEFCTVIGPDAAGDRVLDMLAELGVGTRSVIRDGARATTHKMRVVARMQQVVRVDRETPCPLTAADAARVLASVSAALPRVRGVVLEDYAKGLFSNEVALPIMREAARHGRPVSVDPKLDLRAFAGASLVKPKLFPTLRFSSGSGALLLTMIVLRK